MSPGAGAPSALSAAIAGVSSSFATRRSSRSARVRQHDSPPPPAGSDSCYGVRSLDGSLEWAVQDDDDNDNDTSDVSEPTSSSSSERENEDKPKERVSSPSTSNNETRPQAMPLQVPNSTPSDSSTSLSVLGASPESTSSSITMLASRGEPAHDPESSAPLSLLSPRPSSLSVESPPRLEGTPTPPAASLPTPQSHSPYHWSDRRPPSVSTHTLFDMLADAPSASEPGSPASLDSMCVTSLSSLSRTSSLLEDWRHPLSRSDAALDMDSENERRGLDASGLETRRHAPVGQRAGAELVLPTLSLPSTSLHLGLDRWSGPPSGTRIVLLASPERTRDVLGALAAKRKCVQLPHGHVGVVNNGRLQATVLTGLAASDVRERVDEAYSSLHNLLNPTASGDQQDELKGMVASYASRADWVHLVVPLNDASTHELEGSVPVTTLKDEEERLAAEAARDNEKLAALAEAVTDSVIDPTPPSTSRAAAASPTKSHFMSPHDVDDTPPARERHEPWQFNARLPGVEEEDEMAASTASLPPDADVLATVALLERVLDDSSGVVTASTASFLEWRPSLPALPSISRTPTSSLTASSPASSTFEGAAPLPTIRSAGGEWEATLSRRLAHRRELDAAARRARAHAHVAQAQPVGSLRLRRRRRGSPPSSPPDECPGPGPLFPRPRRSITTASVGLVDLFDRVFAPVRSVLAKSSWTQVAIACAVAIAVGCGYWAVRAQA